MTLLITEEFKKQNRVIKRSAFYSNYPNFVRACFACALVSNKPLSKDTLFESTRIQRMIKVARDTNVNNVARETVSKYLLGICGMDSGFNMSAKNEEQHTFISSLLARLLCELEDYHGGKTHFNQCLAKHHSDTDIEDLISLIELT